MKKYVVLATLCLLVLLVTGCSCSENYYTVLVGGDTVTECINDELVGTEKNVICADGSFKYSHSYKSNQKYMEYDCYKNDNGIEIAFTPEGELRKICGKDENTPIAVYGKPIDKIDKDDYITWMKQLIERFLNFNVDDFEISISTLLGYRTENSLGFERKEDLITEDLPEGCYVDEYYVQFYKYSGKIRTDYVRVWTNSEGDVIGVARFASDIPDEKIPEIDEAKLEMSIVKEMKKIYSGVKIIKYEFDSFGLGLYNDMPVVNCGMEITFMKHGDEWGERIMFIVLLDE